MCVTTKPAELAKTNILSFKMDDGRILLAYSNTVDNTSGEPNCMIIPIPGKISPEHFYDTTGYNNFMKQIVVQFKDRYRSFNGNLSKSLSLDAIRIFVSGMYTVVMADSPQYMREALSQLAVEVRPVISDDMIEFYADKYKNFSMLLCCFSGKKTVDAQPIMLSYAPYITDMIYYPGLDAHDGKVPNLDKKVVTDHELMIAIPGSNVANFTQPVPEFLKMNYRVMTSLSVEDNNDWWLDISECNTNNPFKNIQR